MRSRELLAPCLALGLGACCFGGSDRVSLPSTPVAEVPPLPPSVSETPETTARRDRSVAILRAEGVPVLDSLPVIQSEAESHFRSQDEVVDRAIALFVIGSRGAGDPPDYVATNARDFGAEALFTPEEHAFFANPHPDPAQALALSWRFESLAVMLWALGYRDALPTPSEPMDGVELADVLLSRGPARFRSEAHLRSHAEILDAADLIYRYDWAMTDARVSGRPEPAGLSGDVVMERHQSLNWLIGYNGQAWDDVSNDT